ncbi:hypothetical protein E2C01_077499 [Portunus trituberculatus]|uniref:Uncharacterized protein n=1 Tax=Portunus trituberculatus TaxID=210409 RepID=A0A5B7IRH1_PORTR|nr:hypothetical protein [Portunus trituberculatus]
MVSTSSAYLDRCWRRLGRWWWWARPMTLMAWGVLCGTTGRVSRCCWRRRGYTKQQ